MNVNYNDKTVEVDGEIYHLVEDYEIYDVPVFESEDNIIVIESDNEYVMVDVHDYGYLPLVEYGRLEYYVAEDSESAGVKAREYWREMADNDPEKFKCMVGVDALIAWALGQNYAPGSVGVSSLDEWLDLWLDTPEEHFGSYDGTELEIEAISSALVEELGFCPTVAYRHN